MRVHLLLCESVWTMQREPLGYETREVVGTHMGCGDAGVCLRGSRWCFEVVGTCSNGNRCNRLVVAPARARRASERACTQASMVVRQVWVLA